jgi:hypothetical protein
MPWRLQESTVSHDTKVKWQAGFPSSAYRLLDSCIALLHRESFFEADRQVLGL